MAKRRRKKKNRFLPVLVAIALIIVIGLGALGSMFLDRYSCSDEQKDLQEYYHLTQSDEVAIVLGNEQIETKAKLHEGTYYLDFTAVQELLNDRFYHDVAEELLLYTTPTDIIKTVIGTFDYKIGEEVVETTYLPAFYEDDVLYVALDYVKNYTSCSYEAFTEPNRMQLTTQWGETTKAVVKKDTQIRYRGGVKSEILREMEKGEAVTILEKMDTWTKVKTQDAFIGYVQNKFLVQEETVTESIPEADKKEQEYTALTREHKINLGWHQVMSEAANDTLSSVVMANSGLNVISPTWFSLKSTEGAIRSIATQSYVDKAHGMGLEVWALVDNFDKEVSTFETLSKTTSRTNLIQNLMSEVLKYGIDGINVDFEDVSYDAGEPYVEFLRELSIECRKEGIVLSVDNYVPRESTAHYNRKEQGIVADYVIIMGYDEHWGGGVAGSVASLGFVEDGIKQTLKDVPANKVINALPFYTRVWKTREDSVTSEALDMETAQNFIKSNGIAMTWSDTEGQNYGEIQKGNTLYQIWMEDKDSIEAKLAVMRRYEIGGVAAWKLGYETPDIWDMIGTYMNS